MNLIKVFAIRLIEITLSSSHWIWPNVKNAASKLELYYGVTLAVPYKLRNKGSFYNCLSMLRLTSQLKRKGKQKKTKKKKDENL